MNFEFKEYPPRPPPPADTDYRGQWSSLRKRNAEAADVHSREEFDQRVAEKVKRTGESEQMRKVRELAQLRPRRGVEDSDDEQAVWYDSRAYEGDWLYKLLCPSNPSRARHRIERLYWQSWQALVYGVFLSGFGVMLLVLGSVWAYYGEEHVRAAGVLIAAVLLCIPGFYSLFVVLMYVRGRKGYNLRLLPGD